MAKNSAVIFDLCFIFWFLFLVRNVQFLSNNFIMHCAFLFCIIYGYSIYSEGIEKAYENMQTLPKKDGILIRYPACVVICF